MADERSEAEESLKEIIKNLEEWVANHPKPDEISFTACVNGGCVRLTPREVLREVKNQTEVGRKISAVWAYNKDHGAVSLLDFVVGGIPSWLLEKDDITLKELQDWVKEDWEKASKKKPDSHLQLIYLFEELGEMAEAIRKLSGEKPRKKVKANLRGELGDVLVALATIANDHNIDLTEAVKETKEKIIQRHKKGL